MEKVVLWEDNIRESFVRVTESQLDAFLDLIKYIHANHIENVACESMLDDARLWEWLYSKQKVEMNDLKRELSKRIAKVKSVDLNEFMQYLDKVGSSKNVKVLILSFEEENVYYISTIADYFSGIRSYLSMEKKDEFCRDLQECFPNIHFEKEIETTINTLNRKFVDIREEIVQHLTQINDYHAKFKTLLLEHQSYKEISAEFSKDTGIECSPQAGRAGVQELQIKCFNALSEQEETITCELHTKFKTFNINKEKQDRIYFFPGKKGIFDDKIVVKHIGCHL